MPTLLSLIYRTAGAWGAGKGADLDAPEIDDNIYQLQQAVNTALAATPGAVNNIFSIDVDDSNNMTILMEDSTTFGPFPIPVAAFDFKGPFVGLTDYAASDLFTADSKLWYVKRPYTAGADFVSTVTDGLGLVLREVMPFPDRVRVSWFWPTHPGAGYDLPDSSGDVIPIFAYLVADSFVLPEDLTGSIAKLRDAPTADLTLDICRNGVVIGSLFFDTGETEGVFTLTAAEPFQVGDTLEMNPPAIIDPTARSLTVTLVGRLADLDSSS